MKQNHTALAQYQDLALRASNGDRPACHELVERLWPLWVEQVKGSRRMVSLMRTDDDVHNVVSRLVDKFERDDGRGLCQFQRWQELNPSKTFGDWMRIVMANVERDYLRERLGPRHLAAGEPSQKRLLNEFSLSSGIDDLGARPPMTIAQTARELLEFAGSRLSVPQQKALELWLEGSDFEDIDRGMELPTGQGRKLLRAAVATLRRHFADPGEEEPTT